MKFQKSWCLQCLIQKGETQEWLNQRFISIDKLLPHSLLSKKNHKRRNILVILLSNSKQVMMVEPVIDLNKWKETWIILRTFLSKGSNWKGVWIVARIQIVIIKEMVRQLIIWHFRENNLFLHRWAYQIQGNKLWIYTHNHYLRRIQRQVMHQMEAITIIIIFIKTKRVKVSWHRCTLHSITKPSG